MEALWFPRVSSCPACGSGGIHPCMRQYYWQDHALHFDECAECGSRFANPMPGTKLIERGNNALVRHYQRGRTFDHEFRDARRALLKGRLFGRHLRRWKKNGRILEIGCYNGFFLAGVKETSGWVVEGVEIADEPCRFASRMLGLSMHQGTFEGLELPSAHYDYVIFNDLIEHISEPEKFLREVARVLAPGGRVQLITPNARQDTAFAKRASDRGTPVFIILNHVMFFSPRGLERALERAGFRVRKLFAFDLRHALKDFGVLGLNPPSHIDRGPSFAEVEDLQIRNFFREWTPELLEKLKRHPKAGVLYGFFKETLPEAFRIRMPAGIPVGHEIFAEAEKKATR